jgi:hypothetical protein
LELLQEQVVDFRELKVNGQDWCQNYLHTLGMRRYFDLLNDPTYLNLVKHFWLRAFVYDWEAAETEEQIMISRNPNLRG